LTLPPNIRINTRVPFPALVIGSGPVTITKQNGIWTVGLAFQNLGVQTPTSGSFPSDYVMVWDSIVGNYFRMPLSNIIGASSAGVAARLPAAAGSVPILPTDIEVGINTSSAPTTCPLPSVAVWVGNVLPQGFELCIFDYTGQGATNNITLSPAGTDVFVQGLTPVVRTNYGAIMLRPIIRTPPNGWFVRHVQ
jgi:hypothetical protein